MGRENEVFQKQPCVICNSPILKTEDQSWQQWRLRKTCSDECFAELRVKNAIREKHYKTCRHCKQRFAKKPRMALKQWETAKYCCVKCRDEGIKAETAKRFALSTRNCSWCGERMLKSENESLARYKNRKYCSSKCHNDKRAFLAGYGQLNCVTCKKPIEATKQKIDTWYDQYYCSDECRVHKCATCQKSLRTVFVEGYNGEVYCSNECKPDLKCDTCNESLELATAIKGYEGEYYCSNKCKAAPLLERTRGSQSRMYSKLDYGRHIENGQK